jgi:hypothetical protein
VNVFIGMEESQTIQRAFEERGHHAWSCDFKPGRLNPSRHIQGNVHEELRRLHWTPDLIILHPVCRFLTVSGQHWTGKPGQRTEADREQAVADFMLCTEYAGCVCIENPVGIMSTRWRKPDQIVQPYEFGDDASKLTCLWLQNLPLLLSTGQVEPRWVCCGLPLPMGVGKYGCPNCNGDNRPLPRWGNQTDSGQNRAAPTPDPEERRAARAVTYRGIAVAMAEQWGIYNFVSETQR